MAEGGERGIDFGLEVGSKFCKLIWDGRSRELGGNLGPAGAKKTHDAAVIIAHRMAPEVENYMKTHAPWHDRTGAARNGLFARPYEEGDSIGIVLGHSVPYGIWLEVAHSGTYRIIQPTIDVMGPRVMDQYNGLLRRI